MQLDHVAYATHRSSFVDVVGRFAAALGTPIRDGGLHPRFGTRNVVLPLAGGCYVEVVTALDHPAVDQAPFGRAVRARADAGGGWLTWVLAVDDISQVERRLGRDAAPGQRIRPDGRELRWRQVGIVDVMSDPYLPFFVEWETEPDDHPSADPENDVRITALELGGDPPRLAETLGVPDATAPEVVRGVQLRWVDDGDTGLVAVHLRTPKGDVRLD